MVEDRIASKHLEGHEIEIDLAAASREAKELYKEALRSYDEGTLEEEVRHLALEMRAKKDSKLHLLKSYLIHFNTDMIFVLTCYKYI